LTISSLTLGKVVDDRLPPVPQIDFADRVRAARDGGFAGVGLSVESYREAIATGWTDESMMQCLADAGVALIEVEFLRDWLTDGPVTRENEATARHMVEVFGADHVNAGLLAPGATVDDVAEAFSQLCARLHPVRVAFEYMPFAAVSTVAAARQVLERAGDNAGLCLDGFHWAHSKATVTDLQGLDPARIMAVQLCDVRPPELENLLLEARHHRQVPTASGAAGDLARAVLSLGANPVWSVEAMSDSLRELASVDMCTRLSNGAATALGERSI
jgi:sugar phosphate isomerase/epimerase